jgi:hypothetical protein
MICCCQLAGTNACKNCYSNIMNNSDVMQKPTWMWVPYEPNITKGVQQK